MDNWGSGIEDPTYTQNRPVDDDDNLTNTGTQHQDRLNGNAVRTHSEDPNMVRCSSCQKHAATRNAFEYTLKPAYLESFQYIDLEDDNVFGRNSRESPDGDEWDAGDATQKGPASSCVTSSASRVIFCNHVTSGAGESGGSLKNECACCLPRVDECENLANGNAGDKAESGEEASRSCGDRVAVAMCTNNPVDVKSRNVEEPYGRSPYGYDADSEPIHMTLEEVKDSLKQLYKNGEDKSLAASNGKDSLPLTEKAAKSNVRKGPFHIHLRHKKSRSGNDCEHEKQRAQHRKSLPSSIRQTFCSLFGSKKSSTSKQVRSRGHSKSHEELSCSDVDSNLLNTPSRSIPSLSPFTNRALPPLPASAGSEENQEDLLENDAEIEQANGDREPVDFATSIRQVKDYGWYWGPISGETAERILVGEPDGSFIVRDSSDNHYIFSLTFKLNGLVRHVRIEHDQGNFSFGTFTNFKSQTIVEFIENAVKHSRSGRYLFFLHRRPMLGPMRVQLLHPVSRFKQVQSLQHRCRFVILKVVRWDLVDQLPLPKKLKDYLKTPQYYTEEVEAMQADAAAVAAGIMLPASTPEQHIVLGEMPDHELR